MIMFKRNRPIWGLLLAILACGAYLPHAAMAGTSAYEAAVLADDPFLFYRLGETSGTTVDDLTASMLDGTYVASPTLGVSGQGTPGDTAVSFSGGSQHIFAPTAASTFASNMTSASFELVFSTTTSSLTTLLGSANTGGTTNLGISLNERGANSVRLYMRDENGEDIGGFFTDAGAFDGGFHHLMFTYDSAQAAAADRLVAYLDGEQVPLSFPFDQGTPTNFADFEFPLSIAANNNRGTIDRFLDGTLDEVAIYNSVLSPTDAADRAAALGIVIPNEWAIDGGGSFNLASNWTDGVVPTDNALFASELMSGDAIVTLDSAVSLNRVSFQNADNQYTLAGPAALTLTGDREVLTVGTHHITADIQGTGGLLKSGVGTLVLDDAKSYSGATDVQAGTLLLRNLAAIDNQASATLNIAQDGTVELGAGATGTLAAQLTGAGILRLTGELGTSDTVTLNRDNSSFAGLIRINAENGGEGGTLVVAHNNALGTGGFTVNRTAIDNDTQGKIALPGGVTIANEVLDLDGRSTDAVHLTSSGNNTWNGIIEAQGDTARRFTNIESTSGTLTLNRLYQEQDNPGVRSFVFNGAGDTTITGGLSDATIDIDSGVVTPSMEANVGVIKRDSGVLTIDYATADANDYWFGPTVIEGGSIVVNAAPGDVGELRSLDITVGSGTQLDLTAFTNYSQQAGQTFRGSGEIQVGNTLRFFDDASVAPGDSPGAVGTLQVDGNATLSAFAQMGEEGAWRFDIGNSSNSTGDRLNVTGSFTASGSPLLTVDVTPAYGQLDAGTYTVLTHTGGTNNAMNGVTGRVTDVNGNPLTTRQSITVSGATAGQVNVTVSGEEAARTWNGNASGAWDVATTNNWQEGDQQYLELDRVTFNDSASGTTDVTLDGNRSPSAVTFANSSKEYTLSGNGGIVGGGTVDVTGTGQVTLANSGNNYSGTTTINAGGKLRMTSATTGSINNSGTLSLGVEVTTTAIVQDGSATVGVGGFKVHAFEAEDFQTLTENGAGLSSWSVDNTVAGSSGGEALLATELPSNTATSTSEQNFVTYNVQFTEPGTYYWFQHLVSVDSNMNGAGDDDSYFAPTDNMNTGNTDPASVGSRIENFGSGIITGDGDVVDPLVYDWARTRSDDFQFIEVTEADVASGTVFNFKVATREGGMALDKFVFVENPDFSTDPTFGTLTDADLMGTTSVMPTDVTSISVGNTLNVNGDFTMAAGSTLNLGIASPGTHDQINVQGTLTADGTLNVGASGLAASAGDRFDIFSFASASGSFDDIFLPTLTAGLAWDTSDLLVTGELAVIEMLLSGDFNNDNLWNCADIDMLTAAIAASSTDLTFDMNGDGVVTLSDITDAGTGWLAVAGGATPGTTSGNPYLSGDANLDGVVDGQDFIVWNGSKFTSNDAWCGGDFNADGVVDGQDFIIWNGNKFTASDSVASVPEPQAIALVLLAFAGLALRRRQ